MKFKINVFKTILLISTLMGINITSAMENINDIESIARQYHRVLSAQFNPANFDGKYQNFNTVVSDQDFDKFIEVIGKKLDNNSEYNIDQLRSRDIIFKYYTNTLQNIIEQTLNTDKIFTKIAEKVGSKIINIETADKLYDFVFKCVLNRHNNTEMYGINKVDINTAMINYFKDGTPLINTINEQYNTIGKYNSFKDEESKDLNKQFENYFVCKLSVCTYPVFRFRTQVRISDVTQNIEAMENNITKLCNNFGYRLDNYISKQYREERKDAAFKLLKAEKLLIEE